KYRQLVQQLTEFTQESDFFVIQRFFAKACAIHYATCDWKNRALWYCYRALLGTIYLSYIYKTYWVVRHWQDGLSGVIIFGVLWFLSSTIVRIGIIEWHYPLIEQLHAFLNDHLYQSGDATVHWMRSEFYRATNRFTLAVIGLNVLEIVCFAATNVLTLEDFMLQYRGQVVGGWQVQFLYGVVTMCWGGMYCMGFMVCYLLVITFALETDILIYSMERLNRRLRTQAEVNHWEDVQEKLRPHVVRLMELFDKLLDLRAILNPIAFVQYYSTYLVIADCCFILATGKLSTYSIVYVISMTVFLAESFLLCRGVESLRDLRPRVASALYDFEWTLKLHSGLAAQHRHVRRTFLLLTGQAGQMIRFSFAGIGDISMNSFAELVQKSYSMLTFLLQFAK
uniref:Uncharacterized protein n=2 Tax=Anopheles albimanus TaxID=7167 RepID=A0A182FVS3_ANOAL